MSSQADNGTLADRSAMRLLWLLISGDITFGVLHVVNEHTSLLGHPRLNIELDRGYPEIFQYLKFLWCGVLLTVHACKHARWHYFAWASVFAYFLLDDALRIRERFAQRVARTLDFQPVGGLRLQDYGELIIAAAAGLFLLMPLAWAYRNGQERFRSFSQDMGGLVVILIFLGVVVDAGHVAIEQHVGETVFFMIGMIEDLGEMFVGSVMLWYVFMLSRRDFASPAYLGNWIRRVAPVSGQTLK